MTVLFSFFSLETLSANHSLVINEYLNIYNYTTDSTYATGADQDQNAVHGLYCLLFSQYVKSTLTDGHDHFRDLAWQWLNRYFTQFMSQIRRPHFENYISTIENALWDTY
jgi:hypothetical protein